MRFYFAVLLMFVCGLAKAQTNDAFYGNWIKVKVTFKDGRELPDLNTLKYGYSWLTFSKPNILSNTFTYNTKFLDQRFKIVGKVLYVTNAADYATNSYLINKINKDSLILIQQGINGFTSADCLKYCYVTEKRYQQSVPLKPNDIVSIKGTDTLFRQSKIIHAEFMGEKGFHELETQQVESLYSKKLVNKHFVATFTVDKTGEVDSLHILSGINPEFDTLYSEEFINVKKNWRPAMYRGKPVSVLMKDEFIYNSTTVDYKQFWHYEGLADNALAQGDYKTAIFNYDKALNYKLSGSLLYKKAVCELVIEDDNSACHDLQLAIDNDFDAAIGLKEKYCH